MNRFLPRVLMGRTLWISCAGAALAVSIAGCSDSDAADRLKARRDLEQVIARVGEAQGSFVPKGQEPVVEQRVQGEVIQVKEPNLTAYRVGLLTDAKGELDVMLAQKRGIDPVAAGRLLADLHAVLARRAAESAMEQWAVVSNRGATLMSYCLAAERSRSRADQFERSVPVATRGLRDARSKADDRVAKLEEEKRRLDGVVARLSTSIRSFRRDADRAQARAQELQGEGIRRDAPGSNDLIDEAAAEQRRAHHFLAQAQEDQVRLDAEQSRLTLLTKDLDQTRQAATAYASQLDDMDQWHKLARTVSDNEARAREPALEDLSAYFTETDRIFQDNVQGPFDAAVEDIDQAARLVAEAERSLRGRDQRQAQIDRLGFIVDKAHILAGYKLALEGYAARLDEVIRRVRADRPDLAEQWRPRLDETREGLSDITQAVAATLDEGSELAEQLGQGAAEADPITMTAKAQADRLKAYRAVTGSAPDQPGAGA